VTEGVSVRGIVEAVVHIALLVVAIRGHEEARSPPLTMEGEHVV
jgi:hypothetical protein